MDCFCSINCALGIAFICRAGKHFCRHQVNAFRSKRSRLKSINHPERSLTLGLLCTLHSVILHRHRFIYFFPLFESTQFCDSFQVFDADRMISFFLFHLFILHLRDIDSIDLITFISFRVPSKFFGKAIFI